MLPQLLDGVIQVLNPPIITWLLVGAAIGLCFGVLPAIGATTGVVLFLPFTYGMDLATSVVFLCAIYATGQYGDSVSSILLNTPGGVGTVASCWDGYPMAQRGMAARALGISTLASMIGGIAGTIGLVALAWPLTAVAMEIQPPEYFALGIMALSLVSIASRGETLKGLIMACLGLIMSFVGQDQVSGFVDRFCFGSVQLAGGFPELTIFVAMFAVTQILRMLEEEHSAEAATQTLTIRQILEGFWDVLRRPFSVIRSVAIGMYIGILPALGVATATVTAYLIEKRYSPEGKDFGKGAPSGLIAAETAKGTCVVADMIPTFTLGIPGSITGAIIMTAFILHGIQPGPAFLTAGNAPYIVFAGIALSQILIVLMGLPLIKYFGYLVKVPNALMAPVLTVLCFIGAFVERNLLLDIAYLVGFGFVGYVLARLRFSAICLALGLILGPLVESNFHRTLSMGYGSPHLLWTRPLTVTFFVITLLFLAWPYLKIFLLRLRKSAPAESGTAQSEGDHLSADEMILFVILATISIVILVASLNYPKNVALFPRIVASAMLALIACRVIPLLGNRTLPTFSVQWGSPSLLRGTMSWHWSLASMVGYVLLINIIGFLAATAVYCLFVPLILRYRRRWLILLLASSTVIGVLIFAQALNVILPAPYWR